MTTPPCGTPLKAVEGFDNVLLTNSLSVQFKKKLL